VGRRCRPAEFLSRTCLGYCEFVELWKNRLRRVWQCPGRRGGPFPECEPCCLEKYRLQFPGEDGAAIGLYKLAVFIRLWRKLRDVCGARYTFQQLQDICEVLQLFIGAA